MRQAPELLKSETNAQTQCRIFQASNVVIPSNECGAFVLRNFEIEKLGREWFVIVCEGSFLPG